jgi:peptidoglycan/xylan/chitin deacetylase (PgdA/CDA1 family)
MRSPFILYHKIDRPTPDVKIRGAFTSPRRFEKQMAYLKRIGARFVTATEMLLFLKQHGHFPARTVSITFDDGWRDNYTNAFPIMKKYGVTATIFIVPSVLGSVSDQITAEGEGPREHMTAEHVREMSAAGIEFGSHSMHHMLLNQASDDQARTEIFESKQVIEKLTDRECAAFAYPAGFITDHAAECVREAGYVGALSTVYGNDDGSDPYRVNRTEILKRDGYPFQFAKKVRTIIAK